MLKEVHNYTDQEMCTSLRMSGSHGEHNTPPKRLGTRAMKLDKISHMCSTLNLHTDYKMTRNGNSTESVT